MKKFTLLVLAAFWSTFAIAYDCFPSTWLPVPGQGTAYRTTCMTKDAAGVVKAATCDAYDASPDTAKVGYAKSWWCKMPAQQGNVAGKQYWAEQFFLVHKTDEDLTKLAEALTRILAADDKKKQADIEVAKGTVTLVPGTQKFYEYSMLRFNACKDLQQRTSWPAEYAGQAFDFPQQCTTAGACLLSVPQPTSGYTIDDKVPRPSVYETSWCGAVPSPPQPPVSAWVTSGTSAYNTLNGSLSGYAGSISKGLACDDTVPAIRVGTSTYKHFTGAAKPTIVAACTKTTP